MNHADFIANESWPNELWELVDGACSGMLDDAQSVRLVALLDEDADGSARAFCLRYFELHAGLHLATTAEHSTRAVFRQIQRQNKMATPDSPAAVHRVGLLSSLAKQAGDFMVQPLGLSMLFGAVAIAMVLAVLALVYPADEGVEPEFVGVEGESSVERPQVEVARLTGMENCRWADGANLVEGADLKSGESLRLVSGAAEITFDHGARIAMRGPATISLLSASRVSCQLGEINVFVPQLARGFTVQTKVADVCDLGTAYSLLVDRDATAQVYVLDGLVRVDAKRNGIIDDSRSRTLAAGQAIRVLDTGEWTPIDVEKWPMSLVENDNVKHGFSRWLRMSRKLRGDPSLTAYYTFDDLQRPEVMRRTPNLSESTAGRFDMSLGGEASADAAPYRTRGRWLGKDALQFSPIEKHRGVVRDWKEAPIVNAISLSAWIRTRDEAGRHLIASHWNRFADAYFFHFTVSDMPGQGPQLVLHYSEDGKTYGMIGAANERGGRVRASDGWVHVGFTIKAEGGEVCLYKNGRRIDDGTRKYQAERFPKIDEPLCVGGKEGAGHSSYLDGTMDELAIFARALSPTEMLEIYEAGRPD